MPPLDAAQRAHLQAVRSAVHAALAAQGGWLPFDEYLSEVLYSPGLGYYSAGATKLGPAGDFTTAPEISPLFGGCVARSCAPFLGGGGEMLELGAGSGALAAAVLRRLETLAALPAHYFILEVSADLRARQQALLSQLPRALYDRVRWLNALPARPLHGVVLANEVADALPFKCFTVGEHGFLERGVGANGEGELHWATRPADASLAAELQRLSAGLPAPLAPGYTSELCTSLTPWLAGLTGSLASGMVLLCDYGLGRRELYHPQRHQGTLRCHYRHRAHDDPFLYPGLQDITAWVDFTRLAEAAVDAGLEVAGYCTQAAFLLAGGLDEEMNAPDDAVARARLASEARQLLLPGEMGETFKTLALVRGDVALPPAFGLQDLRRTL